MIIIESEKKDFKEINKLVKTEFPYTKKKIKKTAFRMREGNKIFLAKEKEEIFGFIEFRFKGFTAELLGFAVKNKFQKKGVGEKLLSFFLEHCIEKGMKKISLIVKKENLNAKNLYKSKGFFKTKELKKKIDNAVIEEMQLVLEDNISVS